MLKLSHFLWVALLVSAVEVGFEPRPNVFGVGTMSHSPRR